MADNSLIVAVDFDGILCTDEFPDIGKANYNMMSFVRQMQDAGIETILWTSRVEEKLTAAIKWCEDYGLHFSAVNTNVPSNLEQFKTDSRKIFAHIYIDDRSPFFQSCVISHDYDYALTREIKLLKQLLTAKGVSL